MAMIMDFALTMVLESIGLLALVCSDNLLSPTTLACVKLNMYINMCPTWCTMKHIQKKHIIFKCTYYLTTTPTNLYTFDYMLILCHHVGHQALKNKILVHS